MGWKGGASELRDGTYIYSRSPGLGRLAAYKCMNPYMQRAAKVVALRWSAVVAF